MSLKNSKTKVEDKASSDSESSESESTSSSDSEQEEEKVVKKESEDAEDKKVSKIELEEIPKTETKKTRGSVMQKIKRIGKKKKLTPEEKLKKKHEKETIEREAAEEEFRKLLPVRIYMGIIWLATGAVMILFLVQIIQQLIGSLAQPGNTISILPENNLPYPHVTVCNWNQLVPPATSCPECELQLINCQYFGAANPNQSDCANLWTPRLWNTQAGLFYCWEFNDDKNNILYSSTTGYAGSMAVLFGLLPLPLADPPMSRAAVQATFDLQGATTAQAIYNEISFAPAGYDSFFGLQLIETIHSEYTDMNRPDYNTSRYETAAATVKLLYPGNSTLVYAGVSFSFKTLSKQDITFTYTYTLLNFWGDFAGMIGTLMGLDVIKVSMGIPTAIFSIKAKSSLPLEDLFNG